MAKKTQSATGQQVQAEQPKRQVQAEQPDEAEHKLPAGGTQGGERTRAGRTFRPRVDIRETDRGLVLFGKRPKERQRYRRERSVRDSSRQER